MGLRADVRRLFKILAMVDSHLLKYNPISESDRNQYPWICPFNKCCLTETSDVPGPISCR